MPTKFFIAIFGLFLFVTTPQAADIRNFGLLNPSEGIVINFNGEIIEGDYQRLVSLVEASEIRKRVSIAFNSLGGNISEAVAIGRYIRSQGFETLVVDGCYSACFFAFLGGVKREVFGKLGVHQFYGGRGSSDYVESTTQFLTAELMEYTASMGVNIETLKIAFQTPPQHMYVFSEDEIENFGINTNTSTKSQHLKNVLWQQDGWEVRINETSINEVQEYNCAMSKALSHDQFIAIGTLPINAKQFPPVTLYVRGHAEMLNLPHDAVTVGEVELTLIFDGKHNRKLGSSVYNIDYQRDTSFIWSILTRDDIMEIYKRNDVAFFANHSVVGRTSLKGSAKSLQALFSCIELLGY